MRALAPATSLKTLVAALAIASLAACSTLPESGSAPASDTPAASPQARSSRDAAKPAHENLPNVELTGELMFHLLTAEIAGQRGATALALGNFLKLARETKDPRLAKRAGEIALFDRNQERALEAAQLWVELEPKSLPARQMLTGLLVNNNRAPETLPHLEMLLAAEGDNVADGFLQLNRLMSRNQDKLAVLEVVKKLAARYPNLAEARAAIAQAAANANDNVLALTEVRAARRLRPTWEFTALFAAQILQKRSNALAATELKEFIRDNPKAKEARLSYGRLMAAERNYGEARQEFRKLEADFPQDPEVLYPLGLIAMQLKEWGEGRRYLEAVLKTNHRDKAAVYLNLAQAEEEQKNLGAAIDWLKQVPKGEQYLQAQARIGIVLAKDGKLREAREHLNQVSATTNEQRVQLVLTESQVLRDAKQHQEAFNLLDKGLERLPNHPDLLYDHAMTAEKLNRIDVMEASLKKLINTKPDHAHAYNALGYSLADRNERLPEAKRLVEKALEISPDDAFIIDSLGWVFYRMGDLPRALELLAKAYGMRPDAEIGAHLGEVLWKLGRSDEARKIWREAREKAPDSETLAATIRRLDK